MSVQTLNPKPQTSRIYTRKEWLAFFLFWSWNVIFLAFMGLGFAPVLLPQTVHAVRRGLIPGEYVAYVGMLALIPLVAVIIAETRLRREPGRLLAMGYVVEGPLMLLLGVRLFLIRQATPAVTALLLIAMLGMAAFLWDLLSPQGSRLKWLRLVGLTLMAATSLYAAAWMAFYALPILAEILRWLWSVISDLPTVIRNLRDQITFMAGAQLYMLPFSVLGFMLLIYTASLFVVAPFAVPTYSLRAWKRLIQRLAGQHGWAPPALLVSFTLLVTVLVFIWSNRQPQGKAFALLKTKPTSVQQAQELLKNSDEIRQGLLNAYLARYRYISAVGEVWHIRNMYESAFHMTSEQAFAVQALYEGLARPLLYKPVQPQTLKSWQDNTALVKEPAQAAEMYERFFDTPINMGERRTIVAAARTTWEPDAAQAAWLAVDDREVYLARQELALRPQGDWAELELHEVYENQTANLQEVVYYFSLPESAVITGLWLGNNEDKSQAFEYQVAPRGAAQAVYREETRVMRDPALVEQIGPRQYRLRAYPVPAIRMNLNNTGPSTEEPAEPLHLWMAWREMASPQGWQLPQMAELRNVYWDEETTRLLNQSEMEVTGDDWLPAVIEEPQSIMPSAHRLDLPGGRSILAIPADQSSLPEIPQDLRLAVVLDRSRSMEALAGEASAALETLRVYDRPDAPVDVYLTTSPYRGEEPSIAPLGEVKADEIIYFGGQNAAELLAQFESLRGERSYDAVLVLTDGSGYELGEPPVEAPVPDAPVWVIHLGGFPLGYDDSTLEAIQASGGGVAASVDEALQRLAVSRSAANDGDEIRDLVDGYLWVALPTESVEAGEYASLPMDTSNQGFAALAARSLVLAEIQRNRGTIDQLETLDYLHTLAQEYSIVSPYSSMLVLVNSQQQDLLNRLVQGEDRYDREVEAIGETSPGSPVPLAGVPEPHEWLLLGLAAAMLLYIAYTKRGELQLALRRS